jgi:hypothetical protein
MESRINISLQESLLKTGEIDEIERQVWQTESLYDQMVEHLGQMKRQEVEKLNEKK